MWNIAAVIPVEKGSMGIRVCGKGNNNQQPIEDLSLAPTPAPDIIPGVCNEEVLARGTELLKRTRKGSKNVVLTRTLSSKKKDIAHMKFTMCLAGDLHWKIVSVYIHRTGQVKSLSYILS